jgi:hypothetical protein
MAGIQYSTRFDQQQPGIACRSRLVSDPARHYIEFSGADVYAAMAKVDSRRPLDD